MNTLKALTRNLLLLACLSMPLAGAADPQTGYTVSGGNLKATVARLAADAALKDGACTALPEPTGNPQASYSCAQPSVKTDSAFRAAVAENGGSVVSVTGTCPTNCVIMYCPSPLLRCCNIYTQQPC